MNCIVSYTERPAETEPPGELIYKCISLSGFSASKNSSWATTKLAPMSSTGPVIKITLSFKSLEYISYARSPRGVCSTTIGTSWLVIWDSFSNFIFLS